MKIEAWMRPPGLLATFLGSGLSPVAPGTAGSLAAIAFAAIVRRPADWSPAFFLLLSAIFLLPALWASALHARRLQDPDPPQVVIDEVLGQWITLAGATAFNWKSILTGFLLFRLFDIWKPYPIRHLERLPHGIGILADDVLAGIYAGLVLWTGGCFNLY
jgi:phosphatidylglycerophosphatase A